MSEIAMRRDKDTPRHDLIIPRHDLVICRTPIDLQDETNEDWSRQADHAAQVGNEDGDGGDTDRITGQVSYK